MVQFLFVYKKSAKGPRPPKWQHNFSTVWQRFSRMCHTLYMRFIHAAMSVVEKLTRRTLENIIN